MGERSAIEWTDHTFNPWWGCIRVSPGCEHCYAETLSKRYGHDVWGPKGTTGRRTFGEKHWREPLKWNAAAAKAGVRARVFCASMADVFEDHPQLDAERAKLWDLIGLTERLDWQLLTKRPENVMGMVPAAWVDSGFPRNVWIGTSVEDERRADERIPTLVKIPARVRFLSMEPLLEGVSFRWMPVFHENAPYTAQRHDRANTNHLDGLRRVQWVIVGGESGPGARPCALAWVRTIVAQCREAGVPVFVKQLGARPQVAPVLGGFLYDVVPRLRDRKGGDISEWPEDLRVREFPSPLRPSREP